MHPTRCTSPTAPSFVGICSVSALLNEECTLLGVHLRQHDRMVCFHLSFGRAHAIREDNQVRGTTNALQMVCLQNCPLHSHQRRTHRRGREWFRCVPIAQHSAEGSFHSCPNEKNALTKSELDPASNARNRTFAVEKITIRTCR